MSRVVFGVGTSRTFRVHWTLAELRLSYESRSIRPRTSDTEDPEFRAVSPHGKVPVFCDGALVLRESAAIAFHLAERYGTPGQLMPPAGSDARAIHDQWCWFAVAELDETSLYVIRRHRELAAIYGEAPRVVESAAAYFRRQVKSLEEPLADGRACLLGADFSLADLLVTSCLDWAVFYHLALSDRLHAYRKRQGQREAYQRAFAANFSA